MNTSHLKNGLNGCLDDGIRNITRRTLCALGKGDLIGIQSALEKWQSDGTQGSIIKKVTQFTNLHPEYKDLSKDGEGAYYKGGDRHQGQWIYKEDDSYKVKPIYVHESIKEEATKLQNQGKELCIFVNTGCLIKLLSPLNTSDHRKIVYIDKKPKRIITDEALPTGVYKWRTIIESSTSVTLENTFGQEFAIGFEALWNAGISLYTGSSTDITP